MANFNYTARDKSGALTRGNLVAADRAAALEALKAKGLVPVSVEAGAARAEPLSKALPPLRGVLKAALVVAAAGLVAVLVARLPKRAGAVRPEAVAKPKAEPRVQVARPAPSEPIEPATPVEPAAEPAEEKPRQLAVPDTGTWTNRVVTPLQARPPRVSAGVLSRGGATNSLPSGYSSGAERVLNMIVNTRLGMPPPPLVRITPGTDIEKVLNTDIAVYDGDSEETIERKANVARAKELLKEYLKEGGTAETFVQYYHNELKQAAETRRAAQTQVSALVKAGDLEGARRLMDEQNRELGAKGIAPLTPHPAMLGK